MAGLGESREGAGVCFRWGSIRSQREWILSTGVSVDRAWGEHLGVIWGRSKSQGGGLSGGCLVGALWVTSSPVLRQRLQWPRLVSLCNSHRGG